MLQEAQLAVYSTSVTRGTQPASAPVTQAAGHPQTSSAPAGVASAPAGGPTTAPAAMAPTTAPTLITIDMALDRQLQEALRILREKLATRAAA